MAKKKDDFSLQNIKIKEELGDMSGKITITGELVDMKQRLKEMKAFADNVNRRTIREIEREIRQEEKARQREEKARQRAQARAEKEKSKKSGLLPDKKRYTQKDYQDFMNKYGVQGRNKLTESELRKLVNTLGTNERRNIRRLMEKGLSNQSDAFKYMQESGGMFSTKNADGTSKNRNELLKELTRLDRFHSMKTSTVGGVNSMLQTMVDKFQIAKDILKYKDEAFKLYNQIKKRSYVEAETIGYEKSMNKIFNMLQEGKSHRTIMSSVTRAIRSEYNKRGEVGDFKSRWNNYNDEEHNNRTVNNGRTNLSVETTVYDS